MYTTQYLSPLGPMILASDGSALTGLWFADQKHVPFSVCGHSSLSDPSDLFGPSGLTDSAYASGNLDAARLILHATEDWLDRYFRGERPAYTQRLSPAGSAFRIDVYRILLTIPYGETMTYGAVARLLAEKRGQAHMSAQAVGNAVARNPVSLIIPCHRVVGAHGHLSGYAGGTERKKRLLRLENVDLSVFHA